MNTECDDLPRIKGKRSDVGYKRPPPETRFKKGQKPPPRKKKEAVEETANNLFWRLLHETRPVKINGKRRWLTVAEIIVECAYLEAEKGSPTLQRLLNKLMLKSDVSNNEPEVFYQMGDEQFLHPEKDWDNHVSLQKVSWPERKPNG